MDEKEYLLMDDSGNEATMECTSEMDAAVDKYLNEIEKNITLA